MNALFSLFARAIRKQSDGTGFPELASQNERDAAEHAQVVQAARLRFPGGEAMPEAEEAALIATKKALASRAPAIFNAAFLHGEQVFRVAVLHRSRSNPSDEAGWHQTAITRSTEPKREKVLQSTHDFLRLRELGIGIVGNFLLHLNSDYCAGETDDLFKLVDVTDQIASEASENSIEGLAALNRIKLVVVDSAAEPALSVLHVPWIPFFKRHELKARGIDSFAAVLAHCDELGLRQAPTPKQKEMLQTAIRGERFLDVEGLRRALSAWDQHHPLIYLDFETINPAIPVHAKTKPYQQVAFQFSVRARGKDYAYLHETATDPRPALIRALLKAIPPEGSVVAYYKPFEAARLQEMAGVFPAFAGPLRAITDRLVDPLPILRATFFDPAQQGSYSLKKVAPAILGASASYAELEVGDGLAAQSAFESLISGRLTVQQKANLRQAMLDYCKKDTNETAGIVQWMLKAAG